MPAILEVDNVTKSFGGVRAVDGASFRLAAPGIYGLIGPNGAGKTTLFDVICGRRFADTGHVRLAEQRIDHLRVHQRARLGLARTFQECRVLEAETCLDNVLFAAQDKHLGSEMMQATSRRTGARQTESEEAERLLDLVNLRRLRNRTRRKSFFWPAAAAGNRLQHNRSTATCCCSTNPLPASIRRC